MRAWYVLHCQPNKEEQVTTYIEQVLMLPVYHPKIQQRQHGRIVTIPLFLRYLFIHVDLYSVPPSKLNSLPGVIGLVGTENVPQPIPTNIIEELYRRVDEINRTGQFINHSFQPGDTVRFKSGPLYGLEAVFDSSLQAIDRVRVLLEFMGQINRVDVDASSLERVERVDTPSPPVNRQRRTRGKGRRITPKEQNNKSVC